MVNSLDKTYIVISYNASTSLHFLIYSFKLKLFLKGKLSFWSLSFGHFSHFNPNLKHFVSGSMWFQFYCHFDLKVKSCHIYLIKSYYFVLFLRGKMVTLCLNPNNKTISFPQLHFIFKP
ncbi:hypothetical protein Hanom_Chr16g01496791 [Helianthus anomalus]